MSKQKNDNKGRKKRTNRSERNILENIKERKFRPIQTIDKTIKHFSCKKDVLHQGPVSASLSQHPHHGLMWEGEDWLLTLLPKISIPGSDDAEWIGVFKVELCVANGFR